MLTALALLSSVAGAVEVDWPAEQAWVPLAVAGTVVDEATGDATGALDLVGGAAWCADGTWLWLRASLASLPSDATPAAWGIVADADGDDQADGSVVWTHPAGVPVLRGVSALDTGGVGGLVDLHVGTAADVRITPGTDRVEVAIRVPRAPALEALAAFGPMLDVSLATGGDADLSAPDDVAGCAAACSLPWKTLLALVDRDNDGLPDGVEFGPGATERDSDNDKTPDLLDLDSDGDKHPDAAEGLADPDGDGIPAYLDEDSDGDELPDVLETDADPDEDGLPGWLDADSDGDGIPDGAEGIGDLDGDGIPNLLDDDSDGDGLLDKDEAGLDADCDGRNDAFDAIGDDGFCDTDLPRPAIDDGPFGGGPGVSVPVEPEAFDGLASTGCSATGGAGAGWLGLVLLGLRRRRRA